jgi:hypothetical protein
MNNFDSQFPKRTAQLKERAEQIPKVNAKVKMRAVPHTVVIDQ